MCSIKRNVFLGSKCQYIKSGHLDIDLKLVSLIQLELRDQAVASVLVTHRTTGRVSSLHSVGVAFFVEVYKAHLELLGFG